MIPSQIQFVQRYYGNERDVFLYILHRAVQNVSITYGMQRALGSVVKIKINCDAE